MLPGVILALTSVHRLRMTSFIGIHTSQGSVWQHAVDILVTGWSMVARGDALTIEDPVSWFTTAILQMCQVTKLIFPTFMMTMTCRVEGFLLIWRWFRWLSLKLIVYLGLCTNGENNWKEHKEEHFIQNKSIHLFSRNVIKVTITVNDLIFTCLTERSCKLLLLV